MKRLKKNTCLAWTILICFLTGQYIVFAHQHRSDISAYSVNIAKKTSTPQQIVLEKCSVCDMMHHTQMDMPQQAYQQFIVSSPFLHYTPHHDYIGIALILAAGRSPPRA